MRRFIVLDVIYKVEVTYGRSLEWLAPALRGADLWVADEEINGYGLVLSRRWEGYLTPEEWSALQSDWNIRLRDAIPDGHDYPLAMDMRSEHGTFKAYAFTWDGMEWNVAGVTPIVKVRLFAGSIPAWEEE